MTETLIEGSSKIFQRLSENQALMQFKDAIHGANREGKIEGTGFLRQEFAYYFYRYLENKGIATHLVENEEALVEKGIVVRVCEPIRLEVLVRNVARGHWVDEHKVPLFDGGVVFDEPIVELCLKMKRTLADGRVIDDPRVSPEIAVALNQHCKYEEFIGTLLVEASEAETLKALALVINAEYRRFLSEHGWILEDFKFEVGMLPEQVAERRFVLIDEISPDCSRIRDSEGNSLTKDLFRQRHSEEEIYQGYKRLSDAIRGAYAHSC